LPQESEALQRGLHTILQKYQRAISKYCAYSNMEFIKYLMTYSSKKMLIAWDSNQCTTVRHRFESKSCMTSMLNELKTEYEGCDSSANATEGGGGV